MPKKQLTEKQYKKLLQKIKDAKKAKRKRRQNKNVNQRVSQNVIIGSNIGEKKQTDAGRSFPQIQFLPQMQSQNMDTQLLRDLILRVNSSPLTREVTSRVPYRPSYDLGDQYGLNIDNPVNLGIPPPEYDSQTDVSSLSEDAPELNSEFSSLIDNYSNSYNNDFNSNSLLQPPPEKQGTLDTPIPNPKPNALGQTKITQFYEPKPNETDTIDVFSKATEKLPNNDEFERPNESPIIKQKPKTPKSNKKYLPDNYTINSADTEILETATSLKPKGRPKGSKNKPKENTSKVFTEK